jgi:hypothetical protein
VLSFACLFAACGGSSTPTAPAPLPAASLQPEGSAAWGTCVAVPPLAAGRQGCHFIGGLRNTGLGCAGTVHGTVRFTDAGGQAIGAPYAWTLDAARVVQAGELVTYQTPDLVTQDPAIAQYVTVPVWTDVACR